MSPYVDDQLFARVAGSYPEKDVLLFRVSREIIKEKDPDDNSWSEPVRFRFVRHKGALIELEMHRIDPAEFAALSGETTKEPA